MKNLVIASILAFTAVPAVALDFTYQERKAFVNSCIDGATEAGAPYSLAKEYCNHAADVIEESPWIRDALDILRNIDYIDAEAQSRL